MKSSAVFLKAARIVATDAYHVPSWHTPCCPAITRALVDFSFPYTHHRYFAEINVGHVRDSDGLWFGSNRREANRHVRVMALLFAYQVAKSEGN